MLFLIPIAFVSGALTVFSPCVLPLLPIVLASGIDGNVARIRGTIMGLILSFTLTSLLLAIVVRLFHIPADAVRLGAVILLVMLGFSLVFPHLWEIGQCFIEKYWNVKPIQQEGNGFASGLITGGSLGIVWTPCVGPVVATVATLAALNSFSFISILILLSYATGIGIPLYYIAKGGREVTQKLTFFKKRNQNARRIFGIIILLTALIIYFGVDRSLQAWTLQVLPSSWTSLAGTFEDALQVNPVLEQLQNTEHTVKQQK